jgi:hypothetical protein
MGKCYNVCCDSNTNVSQSSGTSVTQYYFDWTKLPEGQYKVTFSYMSDDETLTLSPVQTIWTDLNSGDSTYQAGNGTTVVSPMIGFLGTLHPSKHGANGIYFAGSTMNPPVMMYKPNNNFFTIFLRNGLTNGAYTAYVTTPYVLMLNFELME